MKWGKELGAFVIRVILFFCCFIWLVRSPE